MRLGKKLSRHTTQTGTDNHKQIAERGVGKNSIFSVDPERLASDKVLNGDCHMCLAYFPRRGTVEKNDSQKFGHQGALHFRNRPGDECSGSVYSCGCVDVLPMGGLFSIGSDSCLAG